MLICKECGKKIPKDKAQDAWVRKALRLCRYCYDWKFPEREFRLPPLRLGSQRLLAWSERREMEKVGYNPEAWSPEFRGEMEGYWKARMRGEL